MTPGSLYLRFRQTFQHGIKPAYYKEIVRKRILQAAPIPVGGDAVCEIHVLTSEQDWLNLLWALRSFYWSTKRKYGLVVHDDGTLTDEALTEITRQYPGVRLIAKQEAEARVAETLRPYPVCTEFRKKNKLSRKLFDFRTFLQSDRMLLLDSDVLFFKPPSALLQRIEDPNYRFNSVNQDVSDAYTVTKELAQERFGITIPPRFNSGLGLIHRDSMRLDWMEEFLSEPKIHGHFWRIEQTCYMLFSTRFGYQPLPPEYDVNLTDPTGEKPSRHYVGAIRHLMYAEGMARLIREPDFFAAP